MRKQAPHTHKFDDKETGLDIVDPNDPELHSHTIDGGKTSTDPYGTGHTHTYLGEKTAGPIAKSNEVRMTAEITKSDDDKRLIYAWASVITKGGEVVEDSQGDTISADELEQAAHNFILNSREAGEMHITTKGIGKIVESMVFTEQMQKALGIDLGQEGWFVVMKIDDDEVWDKVKKGEYKMLSIGGQGKRID